ncbi:intermembrane lipid transfer protein VPS13B-like isoform X2 [Eriocheir sinensis]|uniref:intermembrane lipid transfer protein VPS13B-like isoform X2 n=1 Tax=Eriocheir sinensis TaxID=95602 RepID=UPI0021C58EFC|nr:intermembrane lipid transfer protein VPS13B-like isoform X2 [Eriocheir sinensis]
MLRIESYITPIILSYVDKYIKNLKPEDSQVSLWGGDAVFNNLDLRLEVLEQELRLPFSFVNGHIHELRIHVPWTKLTSEPIVITINTIECILKLKGGEAAGSESSSQSGTGTKSGDGRRRQRRQDMEVPTSYVQGLINRIINNVCVVCNNVILKYVEDDIVLSINVKTLEFRSVDGDWTPAFIDLTAEDLILRNLATLTDLTVCLDKRNASGKIENYQEPLMYRCSLSCRVVRRFESVNSIQPLCTRYDVFCPQLHFSLSDTQLPMFLRLLQLALALYYGDLGAATGPEMTPGVPVGKDGEGGLLEDPSLDEDSWSSWAWSLGSALLPVYWEDEEHALSAHRHRLNKTLHMGIYVETATWTFKLTESVQDSGYFGPTKMRFTPFLRVEHQGSFLTVVVRGIEATNVQLGISSLTMEPVGFCICGIADIQEGSVTDAQEQSVAVRESSPFLAVGQEGQEYLRHSLFDPQVLMEALELWDYAYSWDRHTKEATEANLLARTGAVAMDYFYLMELPTDFSSEKLSEIGSDLEYSNLNERAVCRVVLGACEVNISSGFYHRLEAVAHSLAQHDYPPYAAPHGQEPPGPLPVPTEEEIATLEANTPTRCYLLTLMEPVVVVHAAQHSTVNMRSVVSAKRRKKNRKACGDLCMARVLPVPRLRVKLSRVDLEWTRPMYPKRLVSIACTLRPPSPAMLHNCHAHVTITAHNLCLSLQYQGSSVTLLQGFSPSLYYKSLLLPLYWSSPHQPRDEYFIQTDALNVEASAPQLQLLAWLGRSWCVEQPQPQQLHQDSLVEDALSARRLPVVSVRIHHVEAKTCDTPSLRGGMATLGSMTVGLRRPQGELLCLLASGPEDKPGLEVLLPDTVSVSDKLIKVAFQFPKEDKDESVPRILTVGMKKMAFLLDPQLVQWLKYSPRKIDSEVLSEMVFLKKISEVRGVGPAQRKASESESEATKVESSTATLSEAKTESRGILHSPQEQPNAPKKTWKERFVWWYPVLSRLLVHIDIDSATVFLPTTPLAIASESGLVNAVHRTYLTRSERAALGDTLVLCLPHTLLHNAAQKQSLLHNVHDVPVILPGEIWATERDKLPWSLNLAAFSVYTLHGVGQHVKLPVLKPVNTTATLAITTKYQGPSLSQLGLVIHTDMSPLDFCGSRCQVVSHAAVVESLLGLVAHFIKDSLDAPDSKSPTPVPQTAPPDASSQPHQVTSPAPPPPPQTQPLHPAPPKPLQHSGSDPNTLLVTEVEEVEDERVQVVSETEAQSGGPSSSPIVTAWVQWTVARVSASLYAREAGEMRKLRAEMEDLTMALDLHQVYSKVKIKITSFSVLHFTKGSSSWVAGEHEGVVMTCGDQLTRDVKVINPRSGTVDPHHHHHHATKSAGTSAEQPKPHGFLSLTFTTALCKNIHSSWNSLIKKHLSEERCVANIDAPDHYLSEIDVRVQPFDCVCFPASLHIFASVYEPWLQLHLPQQLTYTGRKLPREPLGMNINNHTLPLVYLHTESIRVLFPARDTSTEDPSVHNMFLLQLESVVVTPQVDNPLSRIMIRPDIFQVAERARILGVPGSEVEDRQYQIDVLGLSASTGSWHQLVCMKGGRPRSSSGERLRVMGENPALEWNNYDPMTDNKNTDVVLHPFLARFDSRVIAAPAIVYQGGWMKEDEEDAGKGGGGGGAGGEVGAPRSILVAGHSLEVNATSDIDLHLSLPQVALLQDIVQDTTSLINEMLARGQQGGRTRQSQDIADSGVDCDISSVELAKGGGGGVGESGLRGAPTTTTSSSIPPFPSSASASCSFVPLELLVTGGKITASIFDRGVLEDGQRMSVKGWQRSKLEQRARKRERELVAEAASTESEPSPRHHHPHHRHRHPAGDTNSESPSEKEIEDGYEGSEEGSVCEGGGVNPSQPRILPLLYVVVSQPHAFLSCQPFKQKLDVSCFNFILRSVLNGFSVKASESKQLPCPEDYSTSWLETKPGDPHPKTGIPPALLVISATDFLHKPACISVEVGRPVRFFLSESRWQQVVHVLNSLKKVLPAAAFSKDIRLAHPTSAEKKPHASEPSTPERLRQALVSLDSISFTTSQIVINWEVVKEHKAKSEIHSSISGVKFCIATSRKRSPTTQGNDTRPDIISDVTATADISDLQLKTVYHSQKLQPFLKPWTVSGEFKLLWLQWSSQPYVEIRVDTETLTIDVGPEHLFCFKDMYRHVTPFLEAQSNQAPRQPWHQQGKDEHQHDILYQDDLRAGIFQYVSLALEDPKPYQVVFDKMAGTMVWCYPEPRTLTRVDIYPVPFIAASEYSTMVETDPKEQVLCALQYFDSLRDTFITYRQFHLSESKFCQLDLPSFYEKQHIAVSSIWRVCIDFSEDDSGSDDGLIVVSPGALAACMRVDSMFSVDLLPRTQAVVNLGQVQVTMLSHLALTGKRLPKELRFFTYDRLAPEEQPFMTVTLENTFLRSYVWAAALHTQAGGSVKADVLSYSFLTNSCLLEPTFLEASVVRQEAEGPDKPACVDSSVTVKPLFIHINQSVIHTLNVAQEGWAQVSEIVADVAAGPNTNLIKKAPMIFMTNYLICNDTLETIRFGQVGTEESILLASRSLHLYCWRSHKLPPKLQACVEGGKWKWCDPFSLDADGPQVHTIHHEGRHFHFLVSVERLSPTQKLITFSGLLSVANCLTEDLEFRIIESTTKEKDSPKHTSTHTLPSRFVAPSYVGDAHGVRVRLLGSPTVWSGEIPISYERTKDSVLVKIALKVKGESILAWCRVLRQRIGGVWRLLVVFSPQYMVRSHLPRPLILHLTTPPDTSTSQVVVKGRGHTHTLHCDSSATHHLTFQLNPEFEVSSPPIPLSRSMSDQIRLSQSQEAVDISQCLQQLFEGPEDRWPYIDAPDFMGDVLFADQPKIDLQVGFSALYPYCNTLVVDIRPWALLVNHTGIEIVLQEVDAPSCWFVPPGAVFAPPKLDGLFTIGLTEKEQHFHTSPLQLSKEDRWYSLKFEGRIPREGTTCLRIPTQDKVYFITLLSTYQENIQVMHLVPTYSITNNTPESLTVRSMYVYAGENKIQLPVSLPAVPLTPKPSSEDMVEVPLLLWHILRDPGSSSSDEELCCVQIGQNGYQAHPVVVQDAPIDQRRTFTLPSRSSVAPVLNRSFLLTCHKHRGQVKMVVQEDPAPQMVIHNNTGALLILGQSSPKEEGIMEEELDTFAAMPSVPPNKSVHYTFPYVSQRFPEILANNIAYPRLHFSQPDILNNETEEVLWSQGVDIQQHYDQFVSIPGHGDVKVRMERVGHTSHIFIDPVSRVEVSARDIRSRIAAEPSRGRVATSTNKGRAIKEKEGVMLEMENAALPSDPHAEDSSPKETSDDEGKVTEIVMPEVVAVKKEEKSTTVVYCAFICTQVVLVLKDDVTDQENISEILRVTCDSFIISLRPKIDLTEKLRALDYRVKEQVEIVFFVGDIQVDNQLHVCGKYDFPVILIRQDPDAAPKLSPLEPIERAIQMSHNNALFTLSLVLEPSPARICIHALHIRLKPIVLYAEDAVFYSLMDILSSFLPVPKQRVREVRERREEEEEALPVVMRVPKEVLTKSAAMTRPVHISNLIVEPLSLLLSVHASVKLYVALDRSPLHFSQFQRSEILTTSYSLGHSLTMHYLSGALIRAGWVVGSLDLLGNPGGFARTVGSGMRDFVQLPYEGILQGPWAFIAGVTHGSLSLVKHLTAGTVVSLTNLASSVARNMERLSLDQDHARRSEASRRDHPNGLVQGLTQGLSSFGISLLGAIGGLAHQPMQALMTEGLTPSSVVGGVGKGLVGIVTKPIGGAADLLVHTGQGLLQGAGWHQEQVPRFQPVLEPHRMEVNAPLKLVWKLVAALPEECRAVLAAVDATHFTPAGSYTPVTVLLTPQVLFILGVEEDAQQHALPLAEVTWRPHPADPTLIYIDKVMPEPKPQNPDMEPVSGCPERVADYVRSTCSEGVDGTGVGLDSSPGSSEAGDGAPGHLTRIKLFVAPRLRSALLAGINIAARASQGRGFIV